MLPTSTRKTPDQRVESTYVHLRVPKYMYDQLRVMASAEDEELQDYVRSVLRDHIRGKEWERERVQASKRGAS
jgi:hypothetical protein